MYIHGTPICSICPEAASYGLSCLIWPCGYHNQTVVQARPELYRFSLAVWGESECNCKWSKVMFRLLYLYLYYWLQCSILFEVSSEKSPTLMDHTQYIQEYFIHTQYILDISSLYKHSIYLLFLVNVTLMSSFSFLDIQNKWDLKLAAIVLTILS